MRPHSEVSVFVLAVVALVAFSCASTPPVAPSPAVPGPAPPNAAAPGGCTVDVWIISWNTDFDGGLNDEDELSTYAEVHERLETCSYAEAIRSWLDRAPEKSVKKPERGYEFLTDFRIVARITSSHGSDLVGVSGNCDWVRRNRKQFLEYNPSLFKALMQPLSGVARRELETYLSHPACGPKAAPHRREKAGSALLRPLLELA
jgi:hypothetical protein